MRLLMFFLLLLAMLPASAQHQNRLIGNANALYRQQAYEPAAKAYDEILAFDSVNKIVKFNRANTSFRLGRQEEAGQSYQRLAEQYERPEDKSRAWYNRGVCLSVQKKLEESIEAYKNALRLNPSYKEARENLQKALLELKKRIPPPPKKEDKKQQNKKQQEQKMNPREAEQDLKLLEQKEKELQQRMQKQKSRASSGGKKDW